MIRYYVDPKSSLRAAFRSAIDSARAKNEASIDNSKRQYTWHMIQYPLKSKRQEKSKSNKSEAKVEVK